MIVDHMAVEASRRGVYRVLARDGSCEIHVITPQRWNEGVQTISSEPEEEAGLTLHVLPTLFGNRAHRVVYRHLSALVRKVKPDFLYVEAEPENYAAIQGLLLRKLLAPRAALGLVSSRNIDHVAVGFPYKMSFTHRTCDWLLRRSPADVLFCRARRTVEFAPAYAEQSCYFPFAIDCSVFRPAAMYGERSALAVGFVGRITWNKGVNILAEAFARLPSTTRLSFVGRGDDGEELIRLGRRLGIEQRMTLWPPVGHSRIPGIMNSLDVLVLPSVETKYWMEQCPRVLIEAMACGVPIVASASGGIPDVVGNAALLFKTGDANELAARLMQFLHDPDLRRQYAERGRARALAEYDVPVLARRLHTAILNAVELRARRLR